MPNNVNIKTLVDDLGNIVVPITHVNAVFDNEGHTLPLILDKYPIDSKEDEEEGTALSLVTTGEKYIWNSKLSSSEKGANNGIATLDNSGKVPSSQLPSYVDDIIEGYYHGVEDPDTHEITYNFYSDSSYTQLIISETGKIYVDLDTNLTYRWSGSLYIVMSSPYVLPTASANVLGGIKVGTNLSIDSNGVLSAMDTIYESKQAEEGGINKSLVTTGEKYTWNNKSNAIKSETITPTNGVYAIYADGSLKTAAEADSNALGVAVITDDCCFIIDKTNNTPTVWDSEYSTNGVISGCTAVDSDAQLDFAGVSNTNAIATVASGGEAAKYCRQYSLIIGGVTKQGYLGACGELKAIRDNKTTVDSIMSTIGGAAISDHAYWSSTLYLSLSAGAWGLYWNNDYVSSYGKDFDDIQVRPFYPITKQELGKTVITPVQTVTIEQSTGSSTTNVMSLNAVSSHILDTDIHVTAAEKEYWNSKVNPPSYSAPTAKNLTYTGEAQDLLNPGSSTSGSIQYSTDETNWSTTVPQATNAGTYTVYWKFAGSEIVYVDSTAINVTIAKANPTYTAPTAKTLTYNGNAQDLVNAGTTNDGTFKYGFAPEQCEYVDLGLSSGTKWAKYNVGANAETDYGNYYMYGKGSRAYNSSDSEYSGTESPLATSVDTAAQVWGGNWHMPTKTQIQELIANTTYTYTTINGVNGGKFTASNGNYIFIPAAGGLVSDSSIDEGRNGCVWSSSPKGSSDAYYLNTYSTDTDVRQDSRIVGLSVRAVIDNVTSLPQGTNADAYTVYWKLEGDENHNDVTGTVEVTIAKVTPTVTAPTAKTLTYNGSAQLLIDAGSTNLGTLQYSLDDETYGTSVPSGTNAGNYTVYYRVVGDSNINDVAAQSVSCSIGKANRTVTISDNQTSMASNQSNTITVTATGNPTSSLVSVISSNTDVATISGMTVNAVGGGTTTITATVASDANYNSGSASYSLKVAWPNGIYAAYADGSMRTAANADSNAIGVAVITDNCKFIIDKTNNTNAAWDSTLSGIIAGCFNSPFDTNLAKTNYTGVSNTNAIAAVASGGEAAKYCRSCSKTIAGKTVYGYLGACGEWLIAYDNKSTIDSIMSTIGGIAISSEEYWSSTLALTSPNFGAGWYLDWSNGDIQACDKDVDYPNVRPFYEIS